jgi:hypothetical protein
MKPTTMQVPKIKALFTPQLREGARMWLQGKSRKQLPARAQLGKNGAPKSYKAVIMALLSVKSWPEALRLRKAARAAAKKSEAHAVTKAA